MITDGKIIVSTAYSKDFYHIGRVAVYGAIGESYLHLYDERSNIKRLSTAEAMIDAEILAMDYIDQNRNINLKIVKDKTR